MKRPITSKAKDPDTYDKVFESISRALGQGELVCIFPEGRLPPDGELGDFRSGIEKILARNPVSVVPSALVGLWGRFFSRKNKPGFLNSLPDFFPRSNTGWDPSSPPRTRRPSICTWW